MSQILQIKNSREIPQNLIGQRSQYQIWYIKYKGKAREAAYPQMLSQTFYSLAVTIAVVAAIFCP